MKTRLIVRKGNENIALKLEDIAFIFRDHTVIIAVDKNEKKYLCDKNLSALEEELDPSLFFRANRKYLINIHYIKGFRSFEKSKTGSKSYTTFQQPRNNSKPGNGTSFQKMDL